jgi:hypothetical protein
VVVGGGAVFFSIDWSARSEPQTQPSTVVDETNTNQSAENVPADTNTNSIDNTNQANANANSNEPVVNINTNQPVVNANEEEGEEYTEDGQTSTGGKVVASKDSDGDGLTDVEEELYQTDKNKPDTDIDGYVDGQELKAGYSPKAINAKLEGSDLVKNYTSADYRYKILYPALWQAKAVDDTGSQMIFQSASSKELVEVIVIEDPLPLAKWYKQYVNTSLATEPAVGNLNGWQVIISDDGLTFYLSQRGLNKIYIINYNIGGLTEINFQTTFSMMINSFALAEEKK